MNRSKEEGSATIEKKNLRKKSGKRSKSKRHISSEGLSFRMREQPVDSSISPLVSAARDAIPTKACVVPYDEDLLERARTQWQFGEWESLAMLERDTLQHHPDRARLALLAAAGHQQQGDTGAARQLTRLAQEWGCSKRLVSQIMISGVYNTLGRAAALVGHATRMEQHFQAAVATGAPGSDVRLLSKVRINQQLSQLRLPYGLTTPQSACTTTRVLGAMSLGEPVQAVAAQPVAQSAQVIDLIKNQRADIVDLSKRIVDTVKKEILNATKQIEAFLGIQSYINGGDLLPDMHGWPISPDFGLYLIELLAANDYDLVIEFGSGASTVLIAQSLAKSRARRQGRSPAHHIAFEHLEEFERKTSSALCRAGVADSVQLELAVLKPYAADNGTSYLYYSCHDALAELALRLPQDGLRVLVMVDGPPGATGKHARYPALPVVISCFSAAQIDVLLDDYMRDDEKEIVQLWQADIARWGVVARLTEQKMEKGACLLSIRS
jgi:hypothetical protein